MIHIERPTMDIHNKFSFKLLDKNGNIKQEAFAYNVANSSRYEAVNLGGDWPGYRYNNGAESQGRRAAARLAYLQLGSGTGTEPSANDTTLLSNLGWPQALTYTRQGDIPSSYSDPIHFSATATIPDSSKYVGTITEVGLGTTTYGYICTHAWVTNAEGQAISINKAATDILVITVDVFFTINLPSNPSFNMKFFPIWATSFIDTLPNIPGRTCALSTMHAPIADGNICRSGIRYNDFYAPLHITTNDAATNVDASGNQTFPINLESLNNQWFSSTKNCGFAHSIVIEKYGVIPLPNSAICPNYAYNGISIGTGDGSTTHFYTPVNETVSQKIFVNGVEQTNGVSFINFDITKSPCWEKCIGIVYVPYASSSPEVYRAINTPSAEYAHIAMSTATAYIADSYTYAPAYRSYQFKSYDGAKVIYYDENGITCDHIRLGTHDSWNAPTVVEYTNDDIFDASITPTWTTIVNTNDKNTTIYFDRTTAKYWRIYGYITSTGGRLYKSAVESAWTDACGSDPASLVLGDSTVLDFGKVGVNFETPPADGAVITMDAVLNLPYKSPDTILTLSYAATVNDPVS